MRTNSAKVRKKNLRENSANFAQKIQPFRGNLNLSNLLSTYPSIYLPIKLSIPSRDRLYMHIYITSITGTFHYIPLTIINILNKRKPPLQCLNGSKPCLLSKSLYNIGRFIQGGLWDYPSPLGPVSLSVSLPIQVLLLYPLPFPPRSCLFICYSTHLGPVSLS